MFEGQDDPILNDFLEANGELFETGKVEFKEGVERFLKTWHGAELAEVTPVAKGEKQFRYRVKIKWYLTPDDLENLTQYTGTLDLPVTPIDNGNADQYARAVKGNQALKSKLNTVLGTVGVLPTGSIWSRPIDNQQTYDALVELLKRGAGKRGSIKIERQRRFDKEANKWVDTDFTSFEGVAAK
jgi:hypothetical protein